ncbi:MAG: hypothetical protein ABIK65_08765 [Candidatus Eisenbacteria bacterium]
MKLVLLVFLFAGEVAAQTVTVETNLEGKWACFGMFDESYIEERCKRFGPDRNHGNQLMRFSYVLAAHVMYPLVNDHVVLRFAVEGDVIEIPAGEWYVEWQGEKWKVDSLFTVLYDADEKGWLTPQVIPLGNKVRMLRTAVTEWIPGTDPVQALRGAYFGQGKGPSWQIHLFAQVPILSQNGIPWSNRGEPFRLVVEGGVGL